MSKKRHSSLSSKWKLSKENSDYKKHKIKKRQGGVGYAEGEPEIVPAKKRGKYPCKKLKGEHKWVLQPEHKLKCMDDAYNFYKCEACGKEHYEQKHHYVCEECGAKEEWFYFTFGHNDRKKCRKCGCYRFKKVKAPILGA